MRACACVTGSIAPAAAAAATATAETATAAGTERVRAAANAPTSPLRPRPLLACTPTPGARPPHACRVANTPAPAARSRALMIFDFGRVLAGREPGV